MLSSYRELLRSTLSHLEQQRVSMPAIFGSTQIELPKPKAETPKLPPKPAPKKPEPRPEPAPPKKAIELQPVKAQDPENLGSMQTVLKKLGVPVLEQPPSDKLAIRIKNSWKERSLAPSVAILIGNEQGPEKTFLINLAKAINTLITPARAIPAMRFNKENTWDHFLSSTELKYVIAPDSALQGALPHLREFPGKSERFLGDKPLLLLPDLKLYFKDPMLKSALWKALCTSLPRSS